jgi:hypothetical protein
MIPTIISMGRLWPMVAINQALPPVPVPPLAIIITQAKRSNSAQIASSTSKSDENSSETHNLKCNSRSYSEDGAERAGKIDVNNPN